jgi:hypothetical protein
MRKLATTLAALFAVVTILAGLSLAAGQPETVKLDSCGEKQPAVDFPHMKHFQELSIPCVTCHHTNTGLTLETAGAASIEKCTSCHLEPEKAETPSCKEMSLTKNAMHLACVSCHKEQAKGPTKCADCHKK